MKEALFKKIAYLIVIIFALNTLAMKFYWYFTIKWFDMPMHFMGGVFIGLLSLAITLAYFTKQDLLSLKKIILVSFVSTLIIGVAWELFEFGLDTFITHKAQDIGDTMSDVCFDMAGSLVASVYYFYLL